MVAFWFGDALGDVWLSYMMQANKGRLLAEINATRMAYRDVLTTAHESISYAAGSALAVAGYLWGRRLQVFGLGAGGN